VGIVTAVKGGPAASAGLQAGDIIQSINGIATPSAQALSVVLAALQPGQTVPVKVIRPDRSTRTVTVKLGMLT
jgi:S1-C subfamily serine protease